MAHFFSLKKNQKSIVLDGKIITREKQAKERKITCSESTVQKFPKLQRLVVLWNLQELTPSGHQEPPTSAQATSTYRHQKRALAIWLTSRRLAAATHKDYRTHTPDETHDSGFFLSLEATEASVPSSTSEYTVWVGLPAVAPTR